jgi:hypothetical protein
VLVASGFVLGTPCINNIQGFISSPK